MTTKDITAADIARELKVSPREARAKLRAAGIRAPYSAKDVAKMKAVIKSDAPAKRKADTPKPSKPSKPKKAKVDTAKAPVSATA